MPRYIPFCLECSFLFIECPIYPGTNLPNQQLRSRSCNSVSTSSVHESHTVKQSSTELCWCCQPSLCCRTEGKQLEEDNGHNMSEIETQKAAVEDAKAQQQYYQTHQQDTQQKVGNLYACASRPYTPVQCVSVALPDCTQGTQALRLCNYTVHFLEPLGTSQCIAMSLAVSLF